MTITESQKRGVFATVVFHTVALLLLLLFGFTAPFPPPAEQGILLDFGNSETGLGLEEPSAGQRIDKQINIVKAETAPKVVPKAPPAKSRTIVKEEEDILTQDYEKTIAINTAAKKKAENEKKIKLENERILKAEEDKQRLEDIENKRLAEEARIKKEAETKQIGTINSRAKNAFGGGGQTVNGSQSTGQGVTYGPGNQGSPDGTPGANQFGLGGGYGNGKGNGPSFSLAGRSAQSLPKPDFPGNEGGIVVVEVTVNKNGKVTDARAGIKGSKTTNPDLLEAAKKAALEARFNSDPNAQPSQRGLSLIRLSSNNGYGLLNL